VTPEEVVTQFVFYMGLFWGLCFMFMMAGRLFASIINRVLE